MRINCYELSTPSHYASISSTDDLDEIALRFDDRSRSRGKGTSTNNCLVAWFLEQGQFLRAGDILRSEAGDGFSIVAAPELVSVVTTDDPFLLMRVAYHLGNRHVPLHILADSLRFQPDHVLEQMAQGLGAQVVRTELPFQPEDGAYHNHAGGGRKMNHAHSHGHDASHRHVQTQRHAHSHTQSDPSDRKKQHEDRS